MENNTLITQDRYKSIIREISTVYETIESILFNQITTWERSNARYYGHTAALENLWGHRIVVTSEINNLEVRVQKLEEELKSIKTKNAITKIKRSFVMIRQTMTNMEEEMNKITHELARLNLE